MSLFSTTAFKCNLQSFNTQSGTSIITMSLSFSFRFVCLAISVGVSRSDACSLFSAGGPGSIPEQTSLTLTSVPPGLVKGVAITK